MSWTPEELAAIDAARELEIAVPRADDSVRPWTPIWAVCADSEVYVRTWYRRETGWFGDAVRGERARVRVPGVEVDVRIEDIGARTTELRDAVDDAYRAKYGNGGSTSRMVGDDAAAATLRLVRV